jgi:hypothetical protein
MGVYNIGLNAARTIAYVTIDPEPLPELATIVLTESGEEHGNDENDPVHAYGGNHVLFHHIRDLLYKRHASDGDAGATFPDGMYDLSKVSIVKYGEFWEIRTLEIDELDPIEEGATDTLVITYQPNDEVADNDHFTYESDDELIATVSEAGVVSGEGFGEATITVTHTSTGVTADVPVTVIDEPAAFVVGNWTVADASTGGDINITITALPSARGSAITALEYRVGAGAWVDLGGIITGVYPVAGLTDDLEVSITIRAVNAIGNGAASDAKLVTPTV